MDGICKFRGRNFVPDGRENGMRHRGARNGTLNKRLCPLWLEVSK